MSYEVSWVWAVFAVSAVFAVPLVIATSTYYSLAVSRGKLARSLAACVDERDLYRESNKAAHAEIKSLKTTVRRLTESAVPAERFQEARKEEELAKKHRSEAEERLRAALLENEDIGAKLRVRVEQLAQLQETLRRKDNQIRSLEESNRVLVKEREETRAAATGQLRDHEEDLAALARDRDACAGEKNRYQSEWNALRKAVADHRDSRGHDRCWLNDQALYRAAGLGADDSQPAGGKSLPELMAGCAAYWMGQLGMEEKVPEKIEVFKKDVMS